MKKSKEDIILIDKPEGISSFDCIRILRQELGIKKMGHSGTLDPLASGLMLIGIEKGTKKLKDLIGLSKIYEVEVLVGKKTSTGDLEGAILEEKQVINIDSQKIKKVLQNLKGKIDLPVPAYSAIKVKGQPLYKRARRGLKVETPIKTMEIRNLRFIDSFFNNSDYILKLELDVGSGTYIRSIAEEIGNRLGYPATVKKLRRINIGQFSVKNARQISLKNFSKNKKSRHKNRADLV